MLDLHRLRLLQEFAARGSIARTAAVLGYTPSAVCQQLATLGVADWRPDLTDPAADTHLLWATMHGLVTIELMHRRWGGPLVAHLQGDPEQNYATAIGSLLEALHGR